MAKIPERKKEVIKRLDLVTGKLSELARYVGYGLAILFYAVQTSDSSFAAKIIEQQNFKLILVGTTGVLAVLLDYFQYLFGYLVAKKALGNVEEDYKFNPKTLTFKLAEGCFFLKQGAVLLGSFTLILLIWNYTFSG